MRGLGLFPAKAFERFLEKPYFLRRLSVQKTKQKIWERAPLPKHVLLKYDDNAQMRTIRPVTPYPGSPLYYYAIKNGLLKDCEDFYENKHLNSDLVSVNFTSLSDEEFHRNLLEANKKLIERYFSVQLKNAVRNAEKLYLQLDSSFRGFRQT